MACTTRAGKARELLSKNKVDVVFGCWTSVSRKSVLPVFEELNGLLFYPVQYEGEESSRNVFYTGAATGGCPHTAIREDASINLAAVRGLTDAFDDLDLVLIESGADNLAATFSPELADLTLYVASDKIPRKGGPGITRSDLLIINKIDLSPLVGASPRGHGPGRPEDARRPALRLLEPEAKDRPTGSHSIHRRHRRPVSRPRRE